MTKAAEDVISIPSALTEELLLLAAVAESNLKNSGSKGEEAAEREGEAIRLSRGRDPFVLILEGNEKCYKFYDI